MKGNNLKLGNYSTIHISKESEISIGENPDLRNYINIWVGKGAKLNLGNGVFLNNYCSINCLESIEIGDGTLFGEGVKLYDHNHAYDKSDLELKIDKKNFTKAAIKIGKNCWLGSNVVVLKGVTIGDNTIIGAGCVIYRDVPANSVVVNEQELASK
ncbi:MAG TPA: acyltransferase [Moheibacter sp.]|nr:acyltransferase [Moheibacter sp.]